jgi:translocation and assembly module TamB
MRRPAKIGLYLLGALLLCVPLVLLLVLIGGNTDAGRAAIEDLTKRLTGGTVQLTGVAGSFPSHLRVAHLELHDARGVWLSADAITLDWSPAALLENLVSVQKLQAAQVSMQRLPQSSNSSGGETSIPRIDVAAADLPRVDLGAELAGAPATLALAGSAHLRSLREMQFDAVARRVGDEGNYDLHLAFDAKRMRAALQVHEPAHGPLENLLSLPGLGALDVQLDFDGPRAAEKLKLAVQAGGLTGHAQGTLNIRDATADLDFDLQSSAVQPRADLQWSNAAAHGHWSGGIKAPLAMAHLQVGGLLVPGGLRLGGFNADVTADHGSLSLRGKAEGLQVPGPRPNLLAGDAIALDAVMRLDQDSRPLDLRLNHRLFTLSGRWLTAGKQSASLDLRLIDLAPFAGLLGQEVGGSAAIQGQLERVGSSTRVALTASADFRSATAGWPDMLGRHANAQLAGTLDGDAITLQSLSVSGRAVHANASGSMSLQQRSLRARWELNIDDLATLSSALAGTFSASGSLQGVPAAMSIEAQANSRLAIRGGSSGELTAKVQMQGIPQAPAGTLSAQGVLDGSPLQAEVSIQRSSAGMLHTVVRHADWKSAHIDGDVVTSLDNQTSRGQVRIQVMELRDLQHLTGLDMSGGMMGSLQLRPEGERTRLDFDLQTQNLTVAGVAGTLQLSGAGASDAFELKADAKVPKLGAGPAALTADGTLNFAARSLSMASATADYHGLQVRLLRPAALNFSDGLSINDLQVGAKQARLDIQGRVSPDTSLQIDLSGVGPELLNALVPNLLAAGKIDAHAELHDSLRTPTGLIKVEASAIRFADDAALGLPAANLTADAQLKGDTADLNARLDGGAGSQLTVSGRAPLDLDGGLDLKIAGTLPITLLNPLLEARGQHAEGTLNIDVSVAGSVAAPQIGGSADLSKGSFRDYGRGVNLTAITAQLVGNQAALEIKSLNATAAPGTLGVTGSIGVLQPKMPIELKITARNAQPIVSKLVTANLNADLTVSGTLAEHVDIGGDVHLNRTLIGIPNSLPPNVAVLDVRRRGAAARRVADKPLVIDLDIKVQAPQQILVQGRGLDAEMGGDLHITGSTDSPRVSGGFDLQRGSFSLASSKLSFSAGHVGFSGEGLQSKIDPTLDFTADTAIPQGTATLHITGYADAPVFDFTSTPALPQDEIMARLMFGESASQLSALQLAQIGAALASLSGVGGDSNLNPLVKVQKTLGLDRLTIGAGTPTNATGTENTGASIEAGRYISKRVYIEAKQSTTGTSQLEADVDLTKRLKLQTRLGNGTASVQGTTPENDPGSSIGLIYQFEY